jgi:alginate O-acetyltransferase complex protein AlgI
VAKKIWNTNSRRRKKILLILSLTGNLGLLGFFKYADFAILQFNILGNNFNLANEIPLLNLALPIGISFYTFQTISYTVDVYRGQLKPSESLKEFALFVSFFPQLVAGPIVRAKDFLPQLREKMNQSSGQLRKIILNEKNLKIGFTLMAIGFFKKMFFADNISPFVNSIFDSPIGHDSPAIFLATIAFGIQIYADFSGYTDIAIGLALIFGFKIPKNFNKPYFAISPSDFWKRWHISLSTWLRDYLYIPLGGNKKSNTRTYLNVLTVMFIGGLWHGASWNFVIWGLLHGGYLAIHKIISDKFPNFKIHPFFKSRIGKIISIIITQYFIFLAWIPFRVHNTDDMVYSIQKFILFDFNFDNFSSVVGGYYFGLLLIPIFLIMQFYFYHNPKLIERIFSLKYKYWTILIFIISFLIIITLNGNLEAFIYFKF